jgi:hypothetical protein
MNEVGQNENNVMVLGFTVWIIKLGWNCMQHKDLWPVWSRV